MPCLSNPFHSPVASTSDGYRSVLPASFAGICALVLGLAAITPAEAADASISWPREPGADAYRIHVRVKGGSLVQTPYVRDNAQYCSGTTCSYSLTGLASGVGHEWRGRPIDGGKAGRFWSWQDVETGSVVSTPAGDEDEDEAGGGSAPGAVLEGDLSWPADSKAKAYRLHVRDASGRIVLTPYVRLGEAGCSGGSGSCTYPLASIDPDATGAREWRYRSIYASGSGAFSNWLALTSVASGGSDSGSDPEPDPDPGTGGSDGDEDPVSTGTALRWSADSSAKAYRLNIRDENNNTILKPYVRPGDADCDGGASVCIYSVAEMGLSDGAYEWRERSIYKSGTGSFSAWDGFVVGDAGDSGTPPDTGPDDGDDAGDGGDEPTGGNGGSTLTSFPDLPEPSSNLKVHYLQPSGTQKFTGGANEDLLLVSPDKVIDGTFKVEVEGFRRVYWIGASFNPASAGWLTSPNGKRVEGVGALVKIRTHKDAVRPAIVLGRMSLQTDNLEFGDFLQLGGDTRAGAWDAWPDVYRCRIIAEPLFGWRGYNGGSFSEFVSHSDFTKFEMGGVRHSYAAKIDVTWGYQGEYVIPSWASDKKPYRGPDGRGSAHYWDYVARIEANQSIGAEDDPEAFFLARSSEEVLNGDHISHYFHDEDGAGVYVVPEAGGDYIDGIFPGGGAFKPIDKGAWAEWPAASGDPFVTGRVKNGAVDTPPVVVRPSEVGYSHRVANRSELLSALDNLCK